VAKTYVISRKTLENLEQVCKRYQTPRDALVEFSIERILPLIQVEKKKHANRKKLTERLDRLLADSRALIKEADQLLEHDDPVFEQIYQVARSVQAGCDEIDDIIDRGKRLEEF
jgi:3-dehydroquinate synthetase